MTFKDLQETLPKLFKTKVGGARPSSHNKASITLKSRPGKISPQKTIGQYPLFI